MKNIAIVMLVFLCNSCGNSQVNNEPFLETASPEKAGVNPEFLENLISDINSGRIQNIHSLVIIKDDNIITEAYFEDFTREKLHYSASVSKSFASALLGIAIDQGFFEGEIQDILNRSALELFPEYAELINRDSLKTELKLKHILSMTSGFRWDEHTFPYSDRRNDCNRINNSPDPMKFLFERRLLHKPGSGFYYNGGLSLAISYLIEKYTGMSVDQFAGKYLFKPLGIDDYRWDNVVSGLIDTDGGLHLTSLDQAKLGYLFLNGGSWQNKQVVSQEWVEETTKMQHSNSDMPDYGYQWWCGDFYALNRSFYTYLASGHGGQKVMVLPEFDMVVVITQQVFNNPFADFNMLAILNDYILPAVQWNKTMDEVMRLSQEDLARFEGNYSSENGEVFIDVITGEGKLIFTESDGQQNDFYPSTENVFRARIMDLLTVEVEFVTDMDHHIVSMNSNFGFTRRQLFRAN